MAKLNRIAARKATTVRGLVRWHGWLRLVAVLVTLGVMSGCMLLDEQALIQHMMGQTDEVAADPQQAESQQVDSDRLEEESSTAKAQAEQEYMRLPEGYSEPVSGAKVSRPVVVTGTYSTEAVSLDPAAKGVPKAAMEMVNSVVAAAESRQTSSQAGLEERKRYARTRAVHVLLQLKAFRQILPTEDMSSPLVTDDTLFLHMEQTGGVDIKQGPTMAGGMVAELWEGWTGVLRDGTGKQSRFEIKVVHPLAVEPSETTSVEAWRRKLGEDIARVARALGPAIVKCCGEMQ